MVGDIGGGMIVVTEEGGCAIVLCLVGGSGTGRGRGGQRLGRRRRDALPHTERKP